jgi:hypothetical protein
MEIKKYNTLGCCGIDCGLCPRYYTEGDSKCPGCFGRDFAKKHPPCSFATCCAKNHNLEACGQCKNFPCKKYDNEKIQKDSFVTHKRMMENQEIIQKNGIEKYIKKQDFRIKILEKILSEYNDGRSKSYFCTAVALLDIKGLNASIKKAENKIKEENILGKDYKNKANILKKIISEYAQENHIEIKLVK